MKSVGTGSEPQTKTLSLEIPASVHTRLTEIAHGQSVSLEMWTRRVMVAGAEDAQPSLSRSGLWHLHLSDWFDHLVTSEEE